MEEILNLCAKIQKQIEAINNTLRTARADLIKAAGMRGTPQNKNIFYKLKEIKKMEKIKEIIKTIENEKTRSKWGEGVKLYALELIERLEENGQTITRENLLNGAQDWYQYSWGGCSLIYDADICERLATPSEQKRTRNGERRPNAREEWLDTQARALRQAAAHILKLAK